MAQADRPPDAMALVIDGWVAWTTSDVSRAILQARLAGAQSGDTARGEQGPGSGSSRGSGPQSFTGVRIPEHPEPWGPTLEVRAGDRLALEPDLGLPIGPSMLAPLPGEAEEGPVEVRIGSNLSVYYDRIRLGRVVDTALVTHELRPVSADLQWRGVAASRRSRDAEPLRSDYDDVSPSGPLRRLVEETTPPGDVLS